MEPHIAPINEFVATLQNLDGRGWLPSVAPLHGGSDAVILSVLRDPGPKTQQGTGSGLLCIENDDPTAEAQCKLFDEYGISPRWVLPWNAYPWYINRKPRAAEKDVGAQVLCDLIGLTRNLRVVLLQGNDARDAWNRVAKLCPDLLETRMLEVIESIHPGPQSLWTNDPVERQARKDKQRRAFERMASVIQDGT